MKTKSNWKLGAAVGTALSLGSGVPLRDHTGSST